MRLFDFWGDLTMWNKFGLAFVVAAAIIAVVAIVRYDVL